MTWSAVASLAIETSTRALDRPLLIGSHVYDPSVMLPIWSTGPGESTDTDISGEPAYLAVDRAKYEQTNPDDSTNDFWLVYAFNGDFDTFAVLNGSLHLVTGLTMEIEIADDGAFTTNLATIATGVTFAGSEYLGFMNYVRSGSGYVRFHFSAPSGFTPYLGEAWLGRRRQLCAGLAQGHDINAIESTVAATSGGSQQTVRALATGRRTPDVALHTNDRESTLLDTDTLRSFWADTNYGSSNFLWCPNPATNQDLVYLCRNTSKVLDLPKIGPVGGREFNQQWVEQPPFVRVP